MKNYFIENYKINENVGHHDDQFYTEEGQKEVYIFAKSIMEKYNFRTVLDVGCGSGYKLVKYLGEYETIGIETEPCFSSLKNKYPERKWLLSGNPEKDFVDYDMNPDLIICSDVIEHILDPDTLVDYLLRFNAKYYILSTPCREVLCKNPKFSASYGKSINGPPLNSCHVREWTMKEFIRYMKKNFNVLESHYGKEQIECQYHLLEKKEYNLCFYTCFYGPSHIPSYRIPPIPSDKYNCYFYTNNIEMFDILKDTEWIRVFDNVPIYNADNLLEGNKNCMAGKNVKINSKKFKELQDYTYTCFLDSKLDKLSISLVEKLIEEHFIKNDRSIILREHWFINGNVWNEFNESMKQDRYLINREDYEKYIKKQVDSGLKDVTEHHMACGLIIRNMKNQKLEDIENTWYKNVLECGIQDQISFFFVKQYFPDCIVSFTEHPFC